MISITIADAIIRLRDHAVENSYMVRSSDPTVGGIQGIEVDLNSEPQDWYNISETFGGSVATVSSGSLLEVLYDLKLLNRNEELEDSMIGDNFRGTSIRQKWHRRRR